MDFFELLKQGTTQAWLYVPVAILLGAMHGLEPGHSKTMMAAFIIAIRGTTFQAALLGFCAAVSHTFIIWLLAALALNYGSQWNVEQVEPYFLIISGLIVVGMAVWTLMRLREEHAHAHAHGHENADAHALAHANEIEKRFSNRQVTTLQIVLFGLSGGLMPCPAAVSILIVCLQLKEFSLGFGIVAAFSLGLALTMISVGVFASWGFKKLADNSGWFSRIVSRVPYVSSCLLIVLGMAFAIRGLLLLK